MKISRQEVFQDLGGAEQVLTFGDLELLFLELVNFVSTREGSVAGGGDGASSSGTETTCP
jgi:hypothetical protein